MSVADDTETEEEENDEGFTGLVQVFRVFKLARILKLARYQVELRTKVLEDFTITAKAPTRAFSWLNALTSTFTFKTQLRHYAKQGVTPR